VAHAFGKHRKTSLGVGWDNVKGRDPIFSTATQAGHPGKRSIEDIESTSNLRHTRIKAGCRTIFRRAEIGTRIAIARVLPNFRSPEKSCDTPALIRVCRRFDVDSCPRLTASQGVLLRCRAENGSPAFHIVPTYPQARFYYVCRKHAPLPMNWKGGGGCE